MTRLTLALALILALTVSTAGASKAPSCKPFGRYPKYVCLCGKVALPLRACEVLNR